LEISSKISVIIVTYNAVSCLEDALLSVVNQKFRGFEIIVIDGGSTDGTVDIINNYKSHLAYWTTEHDDGIYDAMRKGIAHAKGEFIYFLGSDDVLYDSEVFLNISGMLSYDTILYGNVLFKYKNKVYDGYFNVFKLATRNIAHQSIFYPRSALVQYQFNRNYRIFADYDLNIRLFCDSDYNFKYTPVIIAIFDDSGTSGSNAPDPDFERDRLSIMKRYFPFPVYMYRLLRTCIAKVFAKNG